MLPLKSILTGQGSRTRIALLQEITRQLSRELSLRDRACMACGFSTDIRSQSQSPAGVVQLRGFHTRSDSSLTRPAPIIPDARTCRQSSLRPCHPLRPSHYVSSLCQFSSVAPAQPAVKDNASNGQVRLDPKVVASANEQSGSLSAKERVGLSFSASLPLASADSTSEPIRGSQTQAPSPTTGSQERTLVDGSKLHWPKWNGPEVEYTKFSKMWWLDKLWLCIMFAVTGSLALVAVREVLRRIFAIENVSLFQGEWKHRLVYFLLMTPSYSATLLVVGTLFGRYPYTKRMLKRMWSRFLPKKFIDKL